MDLTSDFLMSSKAMPESNKDGSDVKSLPNAEWVSEEDVRSRILVPYLERIGLGPANIRTETSFRVRLGRTVVRIGSEREQSSLSGRLDLLVQNDRKENLFVVEVKGPAETLTEHDRDQAISYARLLEHIAPFAVVTNGSETRLYDTITRERLDQSEFPMGSRYWASGREPSSVGLPGLREEAMRMFFGYDFENLRRFSAAQQDGRMCTLRGSIENGRKYVPSLYVPRLAVREAFDRFLTSRYSVFALIGGAGVGKTNEICALAESSGQHHLALFYNAADLFDSFSSTLADEFNWHFPEQLPLPRIVDRLSSLVARSDVQVLVFVDAVDESVIPNFERELSEVAQRFARYENIKLIVSANITQWDRFASFRGQPSPLALSVFPIPASNTESPRAESGRDVSGPFELGQFDSRELDAATALYAATFNLGSRPTGELLEQCRLPFLLRVVSDVYGGRSAPLPHEVAEPDLVRELIEQRLARTSSPERARLELDSIAQTLVAKAKQALGSAEMMADLVNAPEADVRQLSGIPVSAPVADDLVASGLIVRVRDAEQRVSFRFYYNRIRDYVIARRVLKFDRLSPGEFADQLPTLLGRPVLQDAALWHAMHSGEDVRSAFLTVAQGRALLFVETYDRILSLAFPTVRTRFEPFTDGTIGIAYGLDSVGLFGWGFFPANSDGSRLLELPPSANSDEPYHYQYYRIGAHNVRGGGRDFLVADPVEAAIEFVWRELQDLVRFGGLNEDHIQTLVEETVLGLANDLRSELRLAPAPPYADWTDGLLPFNHCDVMHRIQVRFGTEWHKYDWMRKEAMHESPWVRKSEGIQVFTFPPKQHDRFRELAEEDVRAGRYFPATGSWKYGRLYRTLSVLLASGERIVNAPLPGPDGDSQQLFYFAYSEDRLRTYVEALFLKALDSAQALVLANFPLWKNKFLMSRLPLGVVVIYWREREDRNTFQRFGQLAYGFVPALSDRSWVEVHINPDHEVINVGSWMVETRFGTQTFVRGPRWTGADLLFSADGPPLGPESRGDVCTHTPIRSLAYDFMKDDFRDLTIDDLRSAVLRK